jgi:hypothetical protein
MLVMSAVSREALQGHASLPAHFGLTQLSLDGGAKARQAIFEKEIVCSRLHGENRHFFADRAGHDDEGDVDVQFAEDGEALGNRQARHRVVGQSDVPHALGKR